MFDFIWGGKECNPPKKLSPKGYCISPFREKRRSADEVELEKQIRADRRHQKMLNKQIKQEEKELRKKQKLIDQYYRQKEEYEKEMRKSYLSKREKRELEEDIPFEYR